MCDHDQGGAHGCQTGFQPRNHVEVQMVGGLVKHQKIRCLQQHLGEGHTSFFPATQAANPSIQIVEVELSQNLSGTRFKIPTLMCIHGVVGALKCVALQSLTQRGFVGAHGHDGRTVADVEGVQDGSLGAQFQFLPKVPMPYAGGKDHPTAVGGFLPANRPKQSGFSRAVSRHKRHALSLLDTKSQVSKKLPFAIGFGESFHREHVPFFGHDSKVGWG